MKGRSIEESKYLGGDIEHTHLVKGLDFALLSKVRSELIQKRKDMEARNSKDNSEIGSKKVLSIRDNVARGVYKHLFVNLHPHHLRFREKLKQIETVLLKGTKFKGNSEAFLPGRTCYVFDAGMEMVTDDVPTVLFNSKDDCPLPSEGCTYQTHGSLLNELIYVLQWHAQNRKKKRHEREPRRPGSSSFAVKISSDAVTPGTCVPSVDGKVDDENIYDGVGVFNPAEVVESTLKKNSSDLVENDGSDYRGIDYQKKTMDASFSAMETSMKAKMDIIRDEQGMEVDEDEGVLSTAMQSQDLHTIPAGIDPTSSMAAVYGMEIYENGDVFPYHQELQNNPISPFSEMIVSSFVPPERPLKSGMTTKDQDKGLHSVYKRDEEALKKRGDEDEREKDPAYISDSYMECYPGFGADVSFEMYGSDDEEDRSKMDMGRLKQFGAKRRDDFARQEDWEQYQSKKEALPKAAFQYGRKMDDNRVTRRKKKLNPEEEWKKIEKMLGDNSRSNEKQ